ncbi:MAG: hypothetical protein GX230_00405 [Lentisphaerae bacterium]|jgi:hypothetical protein|nr:hypothetical protein [Lentisphaerota bacterium]
MGHLTYNPSNGHLTWHDTSGHLCFKYEVLELATSGKYSRYIASSLYSATAYSEASPVSLLIPGKQ